MPQRSLVAFRGAITAAATSGAGRVWRCGAGRGRTLIGMYPSHGPGLNSNPPHRLAHS